MFLDVYLCLSLLRLFLSRYTPRYLSNNTKKRGSCRLQAKSPDYNCLPTWTQQLSSMSFHPVFYLWEEEGMWIRSKPSAFRFQKD